MYLKKVKRENVCKDDFVGESGPKVDYTIRSKELYNYKRILIIA